MTCPACLRRPALGLLLTLLLTAPALAQTAGYDDLRALRFYLQQEDSAAVQAELRRLRTAFPDWRPPEDLDDLLAPRATATVDEAAIWAAIERRDFTGARARKAAIRIAGGDPSNAPAVHPLRWPGSWHMKGKPRLCRIVGGDPEQRRRRA